MVLVQKWPFFQLSFLCNIGHENFFYDILERKNTFLCYKNKKFKKSKTWHCSKGVNAWFWSKNGHFSNFFFLRQYRPGNVLLRYSGTNKRLVGYKNKNFKKSKNWHFSKGVNPLFCPKMVIFLTFYVRQWRPGKYLLRNSRTKKRLSGL